MAEQKSYPYATHLNVLHPPLEVVEVQALVDACPDRWYNQTLCQVNGSVVRLGVIHGEYHWHKHDRDDEFFYVVEGRLLIDLEGRTVALSPRQGFVVPRGVVHRTRAPEPRAGQRYVCLIFPQVVALTSVEVPSVELTDAVYVSPRSRCCPCRRRPLRRRT